MRSTAVVESQEAALPAHLIHMAPFRHGLAHLSTEAGPACGQPRGRVGVPLRAHCQGRAATTRLLSGDRETLTLPIRCSSWDGMAGLHLADTASTTVLIQAIRVGRSGPIMCNHPTCLFRLLHP